MLTPATKPSSGPRPASQRPTAEVSLQYDLLLRLRTVAAKRDKRVPALVVDLIEAVLDRGAVDALLDGGLSGRERQLAADLHAARAQLDRARTERDGLKAELDRLRAERSRVGTRGAAAAPDAPLCEREAGLDLNVPAGTACRRVVEEVAAKHGFAPDALLHVFRSGAMAARQELYYRLADETTLSFPALARMVNRNHATVLTVATRYARRHGLPLPGRGVNRAGQSSGEAALA